jgi:hypothetical protein
MLSRGQVMSAAAAAALAAGLSLAAPAAATAATAAPAAVLAPASGVVLAGGDTQCDVDLCIKNLTKSGVNPATIKAWADTTTFTGHFELIYPDGHVRNSPTRTWKAGGAGFSFTKVPIGDGYTMKAWKGSGNKPRNIGTVGFSVG